MRIVKHMTEHVEKYQLEFCIGIRNTSSKSEEFRDSQTFYQIITIGSRMDILAVYGEKQEQLHLPTNRKPTSQCQVH